VSNWEVITGDCIDGMARIDAGIVQTCVTSPPYWGLRDYGNAGQIGLEESPELYVARMVDVFRGVRRILRDDGTVWLNLGDSYAANRSYQVTDNKHVDVGNNGASKVPPGLKQKDLIGIPWRVAFALQADGWYLRSEIVWHKLNPMPESVTDRPTKAHEQVFLLTKSPRYYYDADAIAEQAAGVKGGASFGKQSHDATGTGQQSRTYDRPDYATRNKRSVWTIPTKNFSGAHFAVMPEALVEPCILAGTSERGRCPACGAGWSRVAERTAMVLKRSERTHELGRTRSSGTMIKPPSSVTTGWQPSCTCDAGDPVPCVVFDPFTGSGTVGAVAVRLGRSFVGCEMNPEYVRLAEDRIGAEDIYAPGGLFGATVTRTREVPADLFATEIA